MKLLQIASEKLRLALGQHTSSMLPPASSDKHLVEAGRSERPASRQDLVSPLSDETPFPLEALGSLGKSVTEAAMSLTQAPAALCAQSCLATLSMIASPRIDVQLPHGQTRPSTLNLKTIAKSGERKSTIDAFFLRGVRRLQDELRRHHELEQQRYLSDNDTAGRGRPPLSGNLIVQDATYEGLLRTLSGNRGFAGLFNADAGDFIKGPGMSEENKIKFAAGLSRLWDGDSIERSRQGQGDTFLVNKRLSLHLQFQPTVAAGFIDDASLDGQGFFARSLISWPTSTMGSRFFRIADDALIAEVDKFAAWTYENLLPLPRYRSGSANEIDARPLQLSPKALQSWIHFHDDVESGIGEGGSLSSVEGFAAKSPEHAMRIAAVLTYSVNQDAGEVSLQSIDQAICLARYYLAEILRLRAASAADREAACLRKLLSWIEKRQHKSISSVDVNRSGPVEYRNNWRRVRQGLDKLAERGYLKVTKTWKTREAEHAEYEIVK